MGKARRKEREGDQNSSDTKLYLEENVLERKLPDADLKTLVDIPSGLDYNEWLASHTLALFEHVNLVYGTISEFCTTSGCADMTGPGNRIYLWFDEKGKKTRVAAPQYIDYVMTFTQKTVSDETIFPTKYANEFPSSFESIARKILRLLFHVIAHLYAAHFREIALLGLHTHLNLTFAHLTALHKRFNLVETKETDVLRDLEIALRLTDDPVTIAAAAAAAASSTQQNNNNHPTPSSVYPQTHQQHSHPQQQQQQQQQQHHHHHHHPNNNHHHQHVPSCSESNSLINNNNNNNNNNNINSNINSNNSNNNNNNINSNVNIRVCDTQIGGITSSSSTTLIDGDASIQPICTQPELGGQHSNNGDQSDIRGAGGGGGGGINNTILCNPTQMATHTTA